jgi:hypothetical protein
MNSLQVTCYLSSPLALYDDWSPDLANLAIRVLLEEAGKASPNPTSEQIAENMKWVRDRLPIATLYLNGKPELWYHATSTPCYQLLFNDCDRIRKRWDAGEIGYIDWGKRKAKVDTSQGAEKSYDLPLPKRGIERIDWWCVGDRDKLLSLLSQVSHLGKKRRGVASSWEIVEVEADWHLYRDGVLMRPIPLSELNLADKPVDFAIRNWGWRAPAWAIENKVRCAMPVHNVQKQNAAG